MDVQADLTRIDAADVLELRVGDAGGGALALRRHGQSGGGLLTVERVVRAGGSLRAPLEGLPLDDGEWDVLWVDGDGRTAPVDTTDPGVHLSDRAAYLRRPRRRELRAVRDAEGRLLLRSTTVEPYAEVDWVEPPSPGTDTVGVRGVLAYAPDPDRAGAPAVVARQRGLDGVVEAPARLDGRAFSGSVPLEPLAARFRPECPHNEWDLWLRLPGGAELRLAALADDIADKKRKIVFPGTVLEGGGTPVRVRPYYTVANELSLLAVADGGAR
ncbi:hypothetical protein O4J56_17480 [Nocardiopsis sp. RSe5-2]|uniref:Transferase n=1 Tax=Nocardiopsis endophytica TaxID=3018445 RepID=A0ABT4U669_9ACTN|nr:hypothetical protein [Nocardiopsis endophytica]MDA2812438.1 hypothetical protein [Nocardiopsis endophytica]